jgi:hypothetical protein
MLKLLHLKNLLLMMKIGYMSELPLLLEKFILDLISESTLSNTFMEEMEEEEVE